MHKIIWIPWQSKKRQDITLLGKRATARHIQPITRRFPPTRGKTQLARVASPSTKRQILGKAKLKKTKMLSLVDRKFHLIAVGSYIA